jgi:hypothetical protein
MRLTSIIIPYIFAIITFSLIMYFLLKFIDKISEK